MVSSWLFINNSKTKFMIIASCKQLAKIIVHSVTVSDAMIKPLTSPPNLGAWFNQHATMSDHIGKICSKAFYSLYNLQQIRKCLTDEACKTLGCECTRDLSFRLLWCFTTWWSLAIPTTTSTEGSQCNCSFDMLFTKLLSHITSAKKPSLATDKILSYL